MSINVYVFENEFCANENSGELYKISTYSAKLAQHSVSLKYNVGIGIIALVIILTIPMTHGMPTLYFNRFR